MKKLSAGLRAFIILFVINFAASVVLIPLSLYEAVAYGIVMWAILPCLGVIATYIAVRKGLNAYAAFLIPAACVLAGHWIAIGLPPSGAGSVFLNAGLCLVASATAQVKNDRKKRSNI